MEKSNIVYVESHTSNINIIITEIGKIIGVAPATVKVQKWFQEYSAFVYDSTNGNLLFFKSRYAGYWDADKLIIDYKK
jgi:hypothetical protein